MRIRRFTLFELLAMFTVLSILLTAFIQLFHRSIIENRQALINSESFRTADILRHKWRSFIKGSNENSWQILQTDKSNAVFSAGSGMKVYQEGSKIYFVTADKQEIVHWGHHKLELNFAMEDQNSAKNRADMILSWEIQKKPSVKKVTLPIAAFAD